MRSSLKAAIVGVRDVAKLPDPVGAVQIHRELDEGLILKRNHLPPGSVGSHLRIASRCGHADFIPGH